MIQPKDPIESRRKLHQLLLDQKLYSKSDVEFETQFANPESRAKLHQLMLDKKLYSKSVDDFDAQFFGDLKKKDVTPLDLRFPGQLDWPQPGSNQQQAGSVNISEQPLTTAPPIEPVEDQEFQQPTTPSINIEGFMSSQEIQRHAKNLAALGQSEKEKATLNIQERRAKETIGRFQEEITGKVEPQGTIKDITEDLAQVPPSFNKGVISVASTIPKGVAILAKGLDDLTGVRSEGIEKYSTYQLGQWIEDKAKEVGITAVNEKRAGFMNSTVPMAFGQMMGMMLTGGVGSAEAGLVPQSIARQTVNTLTSPMAMSGALQAAVPEYEAAKAAGKSDAEAFSVFFKNIPGGMTEVIPIANMFSRLNKITGNGLLNALKLGTAQGLEEGSQEAVQQYLTNKIAQGTYDPKRDLKSGLLEGAGAGFIVGFLMPGIMGAMETMTPEDKQDTQAILNEILKKEPEQTVTAPSGDLGVKPKVDEKPKGQVGKVDSKPVPEDIQKESVQVQGEVKKVEEKVKPKESTEKFTVDVAKLQDDGSVKRIREEVEGKPYKKYPSLGLFSHNDPNRTFGGMTVGGYAITEEESGFQVVSGKTIKEAKDKLDELVDQYGGEDAFKKVMEEQIVKRRKNQKAEESPAEAAAEISARKEETFGKGYKVIGVNREGDKIGENKDGVRAVLNPKGIIRNQPVEFIPGLGTVMPVPKGEFLTVSESKSEADKIATDSGFDNASHLINSVKKRTGKEYENVQDIPKEVINRVANERNIEELPPAPTEEDKRKEEVQKLETERDAKIAEVGKPDIKLELVSGDILGGLKVSSKQKRAYKKQHDQIKDSYKRLKQLIECL